MPAKEAGRLSWGDPAESIQMTASPVIPLLMRTRENTREGAGPRGGWYIKDMICTREKHWEGKGRKAKNESMNTDQRAKREGAVPG
jgi:hypothetical protein